MIGPSQTPNNATIAFVPLQTPNTTRDELAEALRSIGLAVSVNRREMTIDSARYTVEVTERAHPTPGDLARLAASETDDAVLRVVIADRISKAGRETLRDLGYGWLDRRGSLRLWARGLRIDAQVPASTIHSGPRRVVSTFSPAAREVAVELLLAPDQRPSPRGLASKLGRSPGYVSTVLQTFSEEGLLDDDGTALLPEMFWALADSWPRSWHYLSDNSEPALDAIGGGVVSGARGAAAWGAPVFLGVDQPSEILLPDERSLRRILQGSRALPGPAEARVAIRVDSVAARSAVLTGRGELVAHPIVCALDLAGDARGREIVEHWLPKNPEVAICGLLEVLRLTGWLPHVDWIQRLVDKLVDVPRTIWIAAMATCWGNTSHAEVMAAIWRQPSLPVDLRDVARTWLCTSVDFNVHSHILHAVIDTAPTLLLDETFKGSFVPRPLDPGQELSLRERVDAGFTAGQAAEVIDDETERLFRRVHDTGQADWQAGEFLLSRARLADPPPEMLAQLAASFGRLDESDDDYWSNSRWHQWSSGADPDWYRLSDDARAAGSLSKPRRAILLEELLASDIHGRAMPLVDLLRYLDPDDTPQVVLAIQIASQSVADLHLRAKVLAEASRHTTGSDRTGLLREALTAARAAVDQDEPSLLAGPERGGVYGLLAVASAMTGVERRDVLAETATRWRDWITQHTDDESTVPDPRRRRRRDVRMLFHSGGDQTDRLVSMLSKDGLTVPLEQVLDTVREVAGDSGNALEGYLSRTAWPALLEGDLQLAALLVRKAREPTAWAERSEPNGKDRPEFPFSVATFPNELVGLRAVW